MRHPFDTLSVIATTLVAGFYTYWLIAASGVKKDAPNKGKRTKWALARLALVALVIAIHKLQIFLAFRHFANRLSIFNNPAVRITGLIFMIPGIAIAVWARLHLGRNWSPQPSKKIGHELITSGPYRIVRHPIYTGMLIAWFGLALVVGPLWMVVYVILTFVFIWRVGVEDSYMLELFPNEYPAYRARTKALIPFVW